MDVDRITAKAANDEIPTLYHAKNGEGFADAMPVTVHSSNRELSFRTYKVGEKSPGDLSFRLEMTK